VHDCKVIQRQVRVESGQDPEPERVVAYVVPAWSVRPDCIDEWVASLEKQWSDGNDPDFRTPYDLIAVSRLPLTGDGQIDEATLACLPLLDDESTRRWEDRLKSVAGVQDAHGFGGAGIGTVTVHPLLGAIFRTAGTRE